MFVLLGLPSITQEAIGKVKHFSFDVIPTKSLGKSSTLNRHWNFRPRIVENIQVEKKSSRWNIIMVTFQRLWRSLIGFLVPFNNKYPFLPFLFECEGKQWTTGFGRNFSLLLFFTIFYYLLFTKWSFKWLSLWISARSGLFFVCRPETLNNCIGQKENGQNLGNCKR